MGGAGGGSTEPIINNCKQSSAEDFTAMTKVTIDVQGLSYVPGCIRVKAGTQVTFNAMFSIHPLQGGTVTNGVPKPDANSPITLTNTGTTTMFTLSNAGDVPYYCTAHATSGMMGAIFVEP